MKRSVTLILTGILFLAACTPAPAEDTATPEPASPPTLAGTATVSPTSSKTNLPSQTPDATLIAYRTSYPMTLEARWTRVARTLQSRGAVCENKFIIERAEDAIRHTNGVWTVFTCSPASQTWEERYTIVKRIDGPQAWRISHQDFNWSQRPDALLSVVHWDEEANIVYLKPYTYPFPSGFNATGSIYGTSQRAIYRLDLSSGEFSSLIPEVINSSGYNEYYSYAFSPNYDYLVYSDVHENRTLHILNLKNNEEVTLQVGNEYIQIGRFVWTPDSQRIIFTAALDGWLESKTGISLISYSLKYNNLQTILYNNANNYVPHFHWYLNRYWIAEDILNLGSVDVANNRFDSNYWQININTAAITYLPTATPWP